MKERVSALGKKRICMIWLIGILLLQTGSVFATEYTVPTPPSVTESKGDAETSVLPMPSTAPEEEVPLTEEPTSSEKSSNEAYTVPETESLPTIGADPTESTEPVQDPKPLPSSDQAYMDKLALAFMDGVREINPEQPFVTIQAIMVGVPEGRRGSAQWFVNGEPWSDYYSSEFWIYTGRTTALDLYRVFDRWTPEETITVALEVHLNGVIRRIEKKIEVKNHSHEWYDEKDKERVLGMVKQAEIEATLQYWTQTYSNKWLGGSNGALNKGDTVIYMDHYGTTSAHIWIPWEGRACWVPYSSLRISTKDYTVYSDFSDEDKEIFVNAKGYESPTEYLVWVNLQRQRVNIFMGEKGNWDLIRVSTCASGANTTPTPAGITSYKAYGNGWYHATYYVKPVLYINTERGIAFHSILFNPNGTVQDGTQGTPASHGCIRMPLNEVQWMADYLPIGTTVVVF